MFINEISIFTYVIVAIFGAFAGQLCDYFNQILPKHKSIVSINTIKDYLKEARPKYLLMVIHIMLYVGIVYRFGINDLQVLQYLILCPMIVSALCIDYKLQIIPNRLTLSIFEVGLIFTFLSGLTNINITINMLQGFLAGGLIFVLITMIGGFIFGKETMGFGDVKLVAALGLFLGLHGIIAVSILSFLIAAIFSIVLMIVQKIRHKEVMEYIPFGPFIVVATLIVIFVPIEFLMTLPFVIFTFGKYKA